jgi:hydroxypyruvate isomerase
MSRIRQTLSYWCFDRKDLPFMKLCTEAKRIGYEGLEMVPEDHWPVAKHFGMPLVTMAGHQSIADGLNRPEHHDRIEAEIKANIEKAVANGIQTLICFSGNRGGMSDTEGLGNTVTILKRLAKLAEAANITLTLELLNSKVDHKDYMADRTAWGLDVVKQVGSMRVKLLYDIYHMQVMEGDVIRTITANIEAISHIHTAGNPGRHEIDQHQELFYPAIMHAIAGTTYFGFVGQEFVPAGDPIAALENAFKICNIN